MQSLVQTLQQLMPTYGLLAMAGIVFVCLVVFGVFVYGDIQRFSPRRIWAIAGVCYRESVRRKVLWITPVAMLGVLLVGQLQESFDAADAIRQTIKFSFFASGLIVVLMAVVVSCTSLPKDIETKVIFTIVTKPATRFEIVCGKVVGFARTTFMLLLLMGVFTWAYLVFQQSRLQSGLNQKLAVAAATGDTAADASVNPATVSSLQYYKTHGLLQTRNVIHPKSINQYARLQPADSSEAFFSGQQSLLVPFKLAPEDLGLPTAGAAEKTAGITIAVRVRSELVGNTPVFNPAPIPFLPPKDQAEKPFGSGLANVGFLYNDGSQLISPQQLYDVTPEVGSAYSTVYVPVSPKNLRILLETKQFYVQVGSGNVNYLLAYEAQNAVGLDTRKPAELKGVAPDQLRFQPAPDFYNPNVRAQVRGATGRFTQLLVAEGPDGSDKLPPIGVLTYHSDAAIVPADDKVALEMRFVVERSGSDRDPTEIAYVQASVRNHASGETSNPQLIAVENNRPAFLDDVPAKYFAGGKFDVLLQTKTPGFGLNLDDNSVGVVASRHSFAWNLAKGMLCQWMLGILAVTLGVFTSTWLSWPIAVVLSFVVLMGRWVVDQLGDTLAPGLGRQLVSSANITDPTQSEVVSKSVDLMSSALTTMSKFLPDVDRFAVGSLVERGLAVPASSVGMAVLVLVVFGLPLLAGAYLVLRNKEVAP
jgi:hypothetical protein